VINFLSHSTSRPTSDSLLNLASSWNHLHLSSYLSSNYYSRIQAAQYIPEVAEYTSTDLRALLSTALHSANSEVLGLRDYTQLRDASTFHSSCLFFRFSPYHCVP